jgi:hypothetical protein
MLAPRLSVWYTVHHSLVMRYVLIGPVIAFNLRWQSGAAVGFSEVGKVAAEHNIQLRTGSDFQLGLLLNCKYISL